MAQMAQNITFELENLGQRQKFVKICQITQPNFETFVVWTLFFTAVQG